MESREKEIVPDLVIDDYRAVFDAANDAIFINDIETGQVRDANKKACEMFCYPKEELVKLSICDLASGEGRYNRDEASKLLKRAADGEPQLFEWLAKDSSGRLLWVEINFKRAMIGSTHRLLAVVRDISERKKQEEALKISEARYRAIVQDQTELICRFRPDRTLTFVNDAYCRYFGKRPEELINHSFMPLIPAEDLKGVEEHLASLGKNNPVSTHEYRVILPTGEVRWQQWTNRAILDERGLIIEFQSVGRDITQHKLIENERDELNKELVKSNKKLKQLALKDPQTGLYNTYYLKEIIEPEFYRARRYAHHLSIIMLDIDYFKSINDVYSREFGDIALKQLADYLKRMVRRYDIVVRFGGEEFVIVSPGIDGVRALILAQRLLDAIGTYNFGNKEHQVKLKVSMAVSSYPEDGAVSGMALIEHACKLLAKAKEDGGDRVYSSFQQGNGKETANYPKLADTEDVKLLKDKIEKLTKQGKQNLMESISAFAKTIEMKDHYTGEHVEGTVRFATETARMLDLLPEEIENIREAAVLHDLGKIGINDKILHKRSRLTKKEFEEIKKHPQIAADIIRPIQFMHDIIPLVLYHHERWDGKGYPAGLRADEIPMGSRIIAVADVYQALISKRPYRAAYSEKEAIKMVRDGAGTQFDPTVVKAFLRVLEKEKEK